MSLLTGILVLVLVCAASVSLAAATGRDAAVFPLPIFAGAVCLLLAGGCLGMLQGALWLCYLLLLAGAAALGLRAGRARWLTAASSTGLLFFAAASLVIWVLFAVLQPMFVEWDEFTFWGMAAKLLKEKNVLYPADPANLRAVSGLPGLGLVSYFVQGFAADFGEWQCLAGYDMLLMACLSAAAALPRRRWAHSVAVLAGGALLPFFFSVVPAGTASTVYANAMADVPLALLFGGVLCLWFAVGPGRLGMLLTALPLALLTLAKDMGFAYALIAVFVIFLDLLFGREWKRLPRGRFFGGAVGRAAVLAAPVLAAFLSWNAYTAAHLETTGASVGSGGLSYGQVLFGGLAQFLGIDRTGKFADLMGLMADAFFTRSVSLVGAPAFAIAAITLVGAAAFAFAQKGAGRRRVAAVWGGLAFCFAAFYLFHLILYYYNFSDVEAYALQDFDRYIGPYLQGWMLAMLCLLGHSAALRTEGVPARLADLALLGASACVAVLFAWRGVPASGFWTDSDSRYLLRQDVKARAAAANQVLDWDDTVLVISQGDNATRWYYYTYELTAQVARGYGGFFNGEDASSRWDSDFMNLVESENWTLYDYKAVCTPPALVAYLEEKGCNYLLIDRADDYLERSFSPLFAGGLTADMPMTLYSFDPDAEVPFTPVAVAESEG